MIKSIFSLLLSVFSILLIGQNVPLNHAFENYFGKDLHGLDNDFHTSVKPYNTRDIGNTIDSSFLNLYKERTGWIGRKLFNEHLINVQKEEFGLVVNPLANVVLGKDDNEEDLVYFNTRGLQFMGHIGEKFSFYSDFYENQARMPQYLSDYSRANDIIPGEGMYKFFRRDDLDTRDYAFVTGILNFRPSKFFDFQFGQGKHFIGDGYRSLLLSDNAFTYPFLKITTSVWKLQYTNLFTQMSDIRANSPSGAFVRKYVSSHYLSINIGKRLNIGLFESVIYEDSTGTRGYDVNYLNPIIFYRPIEFAVGSGNGNVVMGINAKFKVTDKSYIYSQLMIDEFVFDELRAGEGYWGNKFGVQIGGKIYDFILPGLTVQSEINLVRPYTYSHINSFQNYGHYNQPLAHPLGANFRESISHITYQNRRFFGELEVMFAEQGMDFDDSNWGTDIYLASDTREEEYGNEIGQGINTKIFYADLKLGYLFNPKTNLRIQVGLTYRNLSPENLSKNTTQYLYAGVTTNLTNRYYDF